MEALGQFPLGQPLLPAALANESAQPLFVHVHHLLGKSVLRTGRKGNRPAVESPEMGSNGIPGRCDLRPCRNAAQPFLFSSAGKEMRVYFPAANRYNRCMDQLSKELSCGHARTRLQHIGQTAGMGITGELLIFSLIPVIFEVQIEKAVL